MTNYGKYRGHIHTLGIHYTVYQTYRVFPEYGEPCVKMLEHEYFGVIIWNILYVILFMEFTDRRVREVFTDTFIGDIPRDTKTT